ncbi:ABC transporter permease/substrate-binding protein [Pediococcus siamensis]|uniref:ABC transporter permease/substrate-binding protein n=1 Tax=Pediococcus siamensis TaxID=381829 RepID=UPI0039A00453
MTTLWNTFLDQRMELLKALWEHLQISLTALLIAIVIAIPLAIWATHHKNVAEVLLQITSVLQTIPSLALLGLLIPLVGIGSVPAIIALVIYALLPIFQNTYVGIDEIDPSLEEAADAFGMSRMRKLFKVEIPIALPVIISGIRTALVLIIGTATLAALIGAGGLGNFILLGIDQNDTSLIIIGAVTSALLAIILSALIKFLQTARLRTVILTVGVIVLGFAGVSGYQAVSQPKQNIIIAGKLGSEPDILIHMYKDLIEQDDKSVTITLKPNFGTTSFLFNALKSQSIDIYPEFTGTVLESLVKKSGNTANLSAHETYIKARDALKKQDNLAYLKPMAYQNTFAVVVKRSFAKKYNLKTISDLKPIENELNAGMTLEFINRTDGLKGIKQKYGLDFKVRSMQASLRYEALKRGNINLGDAYSTDSQLKQLDLVMLKDTKHVFPPYQGAPVMSEKLAASHPKIVRALNKLAGKISDEDMQKMNYEVNVQKKSAAKVARQYLVSHGLLRDAK